MSYLPISLKWRSQVVRAIEVPPCTAATPRTRGPLVRPAAGPVEVRQSDDLAALGADPLYVLVSLQI